MKRALLIAALLPCAGCSSTDPQLLVYGVAAVVLTVIAVEALRLRRVVACALGLAFLAGCFPLNIVPICTIGSFACNMGDCESPFPWCLTEAAKQPLCPLIPQTCGED